MTPVKETVWKLLDCRASEAENPETGEKYTTMTMAFLSNGETYCIAVTGPLTLSNIEFVNVCRAAAAKMIAASGGDPSVMLARQVKLSDITLPPSERTQ